MITYAIVSRWCTEGTRCFVGSDDSLCFVGDRTLFSYLCLPQFDGTNVDASYAVFVYCELVDIVGP